MNTHQLARAPGAAAAAAAERDQKIEVRVTLQVEVAQMREILDLLQEQPRESETSGLQETTTAAGRKKADLADYRFEGLPLTLKIQEMADLLGIGRSAAYGAVRRGDIKVVRIGRRVLVPRHALLEYLGVAGP